MNKELTEENTKYNILEWGVEAIVEHRRMVNSSVSPIDVLLQDTLGQVRPFTITEGNICIIGRNETSTSDLALYIHRSLADRGILGKIISLPQFINIPTQERTNPHFIYIVHLNSSFVNLLVFKANTRWFRSFFVFAIEELKLVCGLNAKVQNIIRANEIIAAIGENVSLRKYLISALEHNQFLAISGKQETIRTLNQNSCYSKGGTGNGLSDN